MAVTPHIVPEPIPAASLVFGFGPMVPLAAAAVGAWTMPPPWPLIAVELGILCAATILIFVGGVRRGFGFGNPASSTRSQLRAMIVYVGLGGLALLAARVDETVIALCLLLAGFALVLVLDHRAALEGNVPSHFARLRPPQMIIALASLLALLARIPSGELG